jgi:putative flippase GtrA
MATSAREREKTILVLANWGEAVGGARQGLPFLAAKFLGASGLATAFQYALLVVLVELGGVPSVLASLAAYSGGSGLNYWLRRGFVFRSQARHRRAVPRYLVVTGIGLGLTGLMMRFGVHDLGLPYPLAQVTATGVVLGWNFTAHRLWTFT